MGIISISTSWFSGCSEGSTRPARLGSANLMITSWQSKLLRISMKAEPLKPIDIGLPLYSQVMRSVAVLEKS